MNESNLIDAYKAALNFLCRQYATDHPDQLEAPKQLFGYLQQHFNVDPSTFADAQAVLDGQLPSGPDGLIEIASTGDSDIRHTGGQDGGG